VMLASDVRFQGHLTRAVVLCDYRDSDLLHVLEDSVRQHNAIVLGLAPPPPPTPEELAAAKAAEEAAAAAAAAAAEAAAAAAAKGPQRGRSRPPSAQAGGKAAPKAGVTSAAKAGASTVPAAGTGSSTAAGDGASPKAAAGAAGTAAGAPQDPTLASKAAARRSSLAGTTQGGTPRSILKQPQAAVSAAGGLATEPSALTSGMASSRQQPHLRASFAGDLESCGALTATAKHTGRSGREESDAESEEDESSDGEMSEAELRLQAALQRYQHVDLDQRLLQVRLAAIQ
jgi:hypothetical protein